MRRGEVWWASPRLPGGSRKRRPMLVVSDDVFNCSPHYPKVLVVHLTSNQRPGGPFEWEVQFPKGVAGLKQTSVAKCAEIYTLWKEQLEALVGSASFEKMQEVDRALAVALSLVMHSG